MNNMIHFYFFFDNQVQKNNNYQQNVTGLKVPKTAEPSTVTGEAIGG